MSEVVIFSLGDLARWVRAYVDEDTPHTAVAFSVHRDYIDSDEVEGLPVVPFEEITQSHPPTRYSMFVGAGYRNRNELRERVCGWCRDAGYELITVISSGATYLGEPPGDNTVIAAGAVVQPFASVGSGTVICGLTMVSHHASVGDYCYLSPHVTMMGRSQVGNNCFVGGGVRIRNSVRVADRSVIGAGSLIMKDTAEDSVYSVPGTPPRDILSSELDDL